MNKSAIQELMDKYASELLSEEESKQLLLLLDDENSRKTIEEILEQSYLSAEYSVPETTAQKIRFEKLIRERLQPVPEKARVYFFRTAWFKYAAIILLVLGAAIFAIVMPSGKQLAVEQTDPQKNDLTDIGPGGEKAILTLADGSKIILDSAANGQLADEGGVRVVKLANGKVAYDLKNLTTEKIMWNTMTTPKGGQYQVILPDGTGVWLNAASSITFPTAFTGDKRLVKIEGEIYFEVAANKRNPFIVDIGGKAVVEVLGTSFNINSYADEVNIRTSLAEGSVKVIKDNKEVILKPGYQAIMPFDHQSGGKSNDIQIQPVDLSQTLAWKNGIFNFNGADLKTVMRQLERWYDIHVQYKGAVSNEIFKGEMYRSANLSDVLAMLSKMDVHFELRGKVLIITE